ncbi:zinc-dependent alcohol dehydrogenase family protein [Comamonas sp. NoAH]|uniref:zinc-dependent alcohol dehydrogenase family protein n=1 Tax=Comamonas halotolerans TaxID=3041496 RepID=UPI0024E13CA4|nr:zinc-dependent alcohol dehydrogenase family protein [Comamonas sp. NoAH]
MKTRAAVLRQAGASMPFAQSRPLDVVEVDLQAPQRDEVLIKVMAAGICHSDLSIINGDRPRATPIVLGHEAAGIVEQVGEGVMDLEVGDHVVLLFVPSCGHCLPCAEGRPVQCEPAGAANVAGTLLNGERRLSENGQPINHFVGLAAFAEHTVVARQAVQKIDKRIPLDIAALFGCAVMTGVGTVVNACGVQPGQSVAVVGMGGVGLSGILGALAAGATQVIAVDIADDKLAIAKRMGATHTVNAKDADAVAQIRSITQGGVHHALEMVGAVAGLELAYQVTRKGGTTVTVGLPRISDQIFSFTSAQMVAEERTLKGSYMGSCIPRRDVPRYISLYEAGRLPVEQLVTGYLTLDEINEGFDRLARGEAIRQIIRMGEV